MWTDLDEKIKKEVKGGDANMLDWVTRIMVVPLLRNN